MPFKRILVAIDGSALSAHAADVAINLSNALSAELAFIFVVVPVPPADGLPAAELLEVLRKEGHDTLAAAIARVHVDPPPWQFLREGKPATEIVAAAKEWDAGLIVMATHGRSGVGRAVLGSTSDGVVHHAPCPVLLVRRDQTRAP